MKMITKKFLSSLIISIILFQSLFIFSASATEKKDNESYDKLISYGFSDEILSCISDDMMNKIISNIGDNKVYDIQYSNDGSFICDGTSSDNILVRQVNVKLQDKETDYFACELVVIYWKWQNNKPLINEKDLLNIKWYNRDLLHDQETFYSEDYQINDGAINVSKTNTEIAFVQTTEKFVGYSNMEFYSDLKYFKGQNAGCVTFNLIPQSSDMNIDDVSNTVEVEYNHYYKSTVVTIVVAIFVVIILLTAFILLYHKKKKNK